MTGLQSFDRKVLFDGTAWTLAQKPPSHTSNETLIQKFEMAQTTFYSAQYQAAFKASEALLTELYQHAPTPESSKVLPQTLMLKALALKGMGKKAESLEAMREILRVDSHYALDAEHYAPSTLNSFEDVRKQLLTTVGHTLAIRSSSPGAQVFINGIAVGMTHYESKFIEGDYVVQLRSGNGYSFQKKLRLHENQNLVINIEFEASLVAGDALCIHNLRQEEAFIAHIGSLTGVPRVAVLSLEQGRDGKWVRVRTYVVRPTSKLREGKLRDTEAAQPEAMHELAKFVMTGSAGQNVIVMTPRANLIPKTAAVAETSTFNSSATPAPIAAEGRSRSWRVASYVLMGTGIALGVSAGIVYGTGSADRKRLSSLLDSNGNVPPANSLQHDEAVGLISSTRKNANTSWALAGLGAATVIAGGVVFVALPPRVPVDTLAVDFSGDHPQIVLGGAF